MLTKQGQARITRKPGPPRATSELVTSTSNVILTTAEAKTHLRVDHANDDTYIDTLVIVATRLMESYTRRNFLNTTWIYWIDEGHKILSDDYIELPKAPLSSITTIKSYDDDNSATTFASTKYYALTGGDPGRVALVDGNDWPTDMRRYQSIEITYVAGYGAAVANVDQQYLEWIKSAAKLTLAYLYEHRGDESKTEMPPEARQVLAPLRVLRV